MDDIADGKVKWNANLSRQLQMEIEIERNREKQIILYPTLEFNWLLKIPENNNQINFLISKFSVPCHFFVTLPSALPSMWILIQNYCSFQCLSIISVYDKLWSIMTWGSKSLKQVARAVKQHTYRMGFQSQDSTSFFNIACTLEVMKNGWTYYNNR